MKIERYVLLKVTTGSRLGKKYPQHKTTIYNVKSAYWVIRILTQAGLGKGKRLSDQKKKKIKSHY